LEGIIVGGPGATKDYFISEEYLHHELQKKIVDTFDTGYTDEYGLRELVEKAKDKLSSLDLMREKRLIQRLLEEIRKPQGGLAAYGEEQVKHALTIGAVDTLLISEDLRKIKVDLICSGCGAKEERTISSDTEELTCAKCGEEMDIGKEIDLVKELFRMADKVGTRVEMISGESEEGELLKKAFGGMAAILRFSLGEGG
ncbi:MAG TPA: peptide chain release factor 1, partial [Euryarchaeota archaeon]|nr:peptide chain release factor 1 [Euryarchaeota archaeon]